jgi:hypothetical protein
MRVNAVGKAALVVLALNAAGAAIAITNRLPYEFSGVGDPDRVVNDFISGGGTGLSAPLGALIVLAVLALIAQSQSRWGTIALFGLVLLGAAFAYAGVQEPILWRTLAAGPRGSLDVAVVVLGIAGFVASAALVVLAVQEILARVRRPAAEPSV